MTDHPGRVPTEDDRFDRLTERQRACLRLVHDLRNTAEIARELGASKDAIDKSIKGAMAKLGANRRVEAARMLIAHEARQGPPDGARRAHEGVQPLDPQGPDLPEPAPPAMTGLPPRSEAALDMPARLELRESQSAFEPPAIAKAPPPEPIAGKGGGKHDLALADPLGKALDILVKLASASALVCLLAVLISHFYRR